MPFTSNATTSMPNFNASNRCWASSRTRLRNDSSPEPSASSIFVVASVRVAASKSVPSMMGVRGGRLRRAGERERIGDPVAHGEPCLHDVRVAGERVAIEHRMESLAGMEELDAANPTLAAGRTRLQGGRHTAGACWRRSQVWGGWPPKLRLAPRH
jgi:hypothetical protein